jgi:ribosome biogenesis protein Nip4
MDTVSAQNNRSVGDFISSLDDEQTVKDSLVLIELMQRISGHEPKMWNVGTLGFDTYHYTYDSGREGECQTIGFYPRRGKITVYLMDGTVRYSELLARLGKHSTSRVCVYIKRLSDIQLPILEQIVQQSYEYVKSQDGHMHRAAE